MLLVQADAVLASGDQLYGRIADLEALQRERLDAPLRADNLKEARRFIEAQSA